MWTNVPRQKKTFLNVDSNNEQSTVLKPRFFSTSEKDVGFLVSSSFFHSFMSPAIKWKYYLPFSSPIENIERVKGFCQTLRASLKDLMKNQIIIITPVFAVGFYYHYVKLPQGKHNFHCSPSLLKQVIVGIVTHLTGQSQAEHWSPQTLPPAIPEGFL